MRVLDLGSGAGVDTLAGRLEREIDAAEGRVESVPAVGVGTTRP